MKSLIFLLILLNIDCIKYVMRYNTSMCFMTYVSFDIQHVLLLGITGLAIIALIAVIIMFGVSNHKDENHFREIKDLSNSLRVFVIDIQNDTVKYFNSAHLRDRKTSSITSFYNQYKSKEREMLINWIGNLLENNEETPKFLEIGVYIRSSKRTVTSILEVQKIDYKKQLIFIESHLLPTTFKGKHKGDKPEFVKKEYLFKKISLNNGKGATYALNFYNKHTKTADISQLVYADLRDIMVGFSSETVFVVEEKFGQILVTNFEVKGKLEISAFVETLKARINRFLLIKSHSDDIEYTIGVIKNSENFRDGQALIKNALMVSDLTKDTENQVAYFDDIKTMLIDDQGKQFRTDVQEVIEDNKLRYYFQPIYNVDRNRVVAYQSSVVPYDSYFHEIDTLKNYAMRTEDDKVLFSTITKNVISRFIQEKNDDHVLLFFPVSFNEINFVNRSLGHTSGVNDIHIVLVLKERDLSALPDEYEEETLINTIRSFKSKGYAVALEIDDSILTLSPTLYGSFDYFNLSVATHISKKNAGRNLPSFQGLIEKLLHYEKPIVALDIQSWDIVELVYRLGVSNICSDAIAPPNENIMPIQRKIITKIKNLKS